MDAEGAEDSRAGLEGDVRWNELGLVQSYCYCLWGAFSRVNRPLQLASVLSRRQLGGVIRERIKKWAKEWAKAKQCRKAQMQCSHSFVPGAPFHLCPPADVMSNLELQSDLFRYCSFFLGLGGV